MQIKITPNDAGNPPGKLADAELHFDGADPLAGLKLIGFSIWERRGTKTITVTFPARQYSVNGERRSFALLRPIIDTTAQGTIRDAIIQAWNEYAISTYEQTDQARQDAEALRQADTCQADYPTDAAARAAATGQAQPTPDGGSVEPDGFKWAPDTAPAKVEQPEPAPPAKKTPPDIQF